MAPKAPKRRHEDTQDPAAQDAGAAAVAVGVVAKITMVKHVTQNGTGDHKDKTKHRNCQEGNKRRCACQKNHVGGLCIRRVRCTSRGTVAGRTMSLAVTATLRPVCGEVKMSWPLEAEVYVSGIYGTGYIIHPSTNATPTKAANTLAP